MCPLRFWCPEASPWNERNFLGPRLGGRYLPGQNLSLVLGAPEAVFSRWEKTVVPDGKGTSLG